MPTRPSTLRHSLDTVCCALLLVIIAGCGTGDSSTEPKSPTDDANVTQTSDGAANINTPAQSPFDATNENTPAEQVTANDVPDKPADIEKSKPAEVDPPPQNSSATKASKELDTALADLEVPPAWLASITTRWDMNKP